MGGFLLLLPVVAGLSLGQGEPAAAGDARAPAREEQPAKEPNPAPASAPSAPSTQPSPPRSGGEGDPRPSTSTTNPRPPPTSHPTAPPSSPDPDRTQVAKTALAFLDALVARNADALAAVSAERFSFDGEVRTGRDAVRRTWRELLSRRAAPQDALLDLEILPAADAVARLGPAPARVAPLAARGAWIGIANVSGRAVILFLAREGGRWTVAGLHD
jgi:hypothetical protein